MTNPLPNPIPAGSRLYSDANDAEKIECHDIDRPLHILTDEQVEAVKDAIGWIRAIKWAAHSDEESHNHQSLRSIHEILERAFAPILDAPKVEERKTLRELHNEWLESYRKTYGHDPLETALAYHEAVIDRIDTLERGRRDA